MRDHRDLVIEWLAASEAELREDAARYRLLAVEAIHRLHELQRELDAVRARHHRLLDEFRFVREERMRRAA